jgi:ABC-type molybdate transport system substrate-binding protein
MLCAYAQEPEGLTVFCGASLTGAFNEIGQMVPDEYNVVGKFPLGTLKQSRYPEEAQGFMDLVMSEEGQAILDKYGFIPVKEM